MWRVLRLAGLAILGAFALTAAGRESLEEGTRQWQVFHQMIVKLTGVSHA